MTIKHLIAMGATERVVVAGYPARDSDKMKFYFDQLPEELRKAME